MQTITTLIPGRPGSMESMTESLDPSRKKQGATTFLSLLRPLGTSGRARRSLPADI